MTREELIRRHFDRSMRLIEIGPSHRPIIPKADGWQTTIIDHADQAELVRKYEAMQVTTDSIEPVDYIWRGQSLSRLLPETLHGRFDGLVASHVGEHLPDLIALFKDASTLLGPGGLVALALPDKRVCFDFFQPLTTTGDVVDAHVLGRTRHQRRTIFNHTAYSARRNNEGGWLHTGNSAPFKLVNSIFDAKRAYEEASEDPSVPYRDCHAWAFTPKSFELLMLELNLLGYVEWAVRSIEAAEGVEFFVWLERKRVALSESEERAARESLLAGIIRESMSQIAQLHESQPVPNAEDVAAGVGAYQVSGWPRPRPSIAVVVPLYNGSRYIEEALQSVFKQSLLPDEVVVVDDGSTDDGAGAAIVERLAVQYPIRLLRKPNGGQSSARNFGVQESHSDLIAFLDQDDVWYENHLAELIRPFLTWSARPIGWVYSNLDEVNEEGTLVCRDFLTTLKTPHPKRLIYDCIRTDMYVLPSASLISRQAFKAIGGFDERLCGYEDDDLFLRIFLSGYDNIFLDMPLSKWRIYSGSTSYTFRMARSRSIYMRKLQSLFPDDLKRARYYMRDVIVPRFLEHAIREYIAAAEGTDLEGIAFAWNELVFLGGINSNLAPVLLPPLLSLYRRALVRRDDTLISLTWAELARVSRHLPPGHERLKIILKLLRSPLVAKSAFAARRLARPIMLWAFIPSRRSRLLRSVPG